MHNGIFDVESKMYLFLNKATDIFMHSLLLVVFSFPVITAGAALSAFYYGLMKISDNSDSGVWRDFWRGFRNAFYKATVLWIIQIALMCLLVVNMLIGLRMGSDLGTVIMVTNGMLLMLVFAVTLYVYPLAAYYNFTFRKTLCDAGAIALGHLPHSLGLIALAVIFGAVIYFIPQAFIFALPVYGYQIARVNVWIFNGYQRSCDGAAEQAEERV